MTTEVYMTIADFLSKFHQTLPTSPGLLPFGFGWSATICSVDKTILAISAGFCREKRRDWY